MYSVGETIYMANNYNQDDDDDFQDIDRRLPPLSQKKTPQGFTNSKIKSSNQQLKNLSSQPRPLNSTIICNGRSSQRAKATAAAAATGSENEPPSAAAASMSKQTLGFQSKAPFEPLPPPIFYPDSTARNFVGLDSAMDSEHTPPVCGDSASKKESDSYSSNSLESRLLTSIVNPFDCSSSGHNGCSLENQGNFDDDEEEEEDCTQLDLLLKLYSESNKNDGNSSSSSGTTDCGLDNIPINCPLCGIDISHLTHESRQLHTNHCLDKGDTQNVACPNDDVQPMCPGQVVDGSLIQSPPQIGDISPVLVWLQNLGLARYQEVFTQQEIDWDTLHWLTEEDLCNIGVTALGPRKKIVHALSELRKGITKSAEIRTDAPRSDETSRLSENKLITDYFPGTVGHRKNACASSRGHLEAEKSRSDTQRKKIAVKKNVMTKKLRDIPQWCCIPGTPFRVDAFKYLRRDCSHWFLTHFHIDHYQGLTRSFCHGKIYCSLITARLVNMKIGIPWDKFQVLPLNQKISISGIDVECFDANHCPGSIILLFEPPNGKAVLHTGDFRFCEEMTKIPVLQLCSVQTLILDTTYCNPQYDFPKQEAVIQFVIEAIQAEAFNPKTLFLIGSYTIGKERLFLEVARVLCKKVYVTAAKQRLLECLGLSGEDMQWLTSNEQESHIHVVPMWTLASFKRLKCISNQYAHRFSLIVAFSPTGWTFGKGKKSSGRRWQQGTIVRYEVPYSEHCSFTELKEFVKFISPENIIPSVNNDGLESANAMVSLLRS